MASQQDTRRKEVKAEQAARTAADELHDVNKQRAGGGADVVVEHHETRTDDRNRPGIIGSVFQTVTGALGGAKDAVIGKTHEGTEKANIVGRDAAERERRNEEDAVRKAEEYKEAAARKAAETKDAAMEKSREYKDYTAQKAKEAAEKTGEYKDYTAEKAKEAKDRTMGKMKEYKDTAVEKTKETADATAQKAKEMKDTTVGKLGEYKDSAVEKTKETAEKAKEAKDYTAEKTKETADATAQKAKEGKDSAVGKLTELKDKAMGLFSGRKDENTERAGTGRTGDYFTKSALDEAEDDARRKLETMHLKDQGYEAKGTKMDITTGGRSGGRGEEEVVAATVAVERVGGAAEAFRKADQMTGQAFNDVGPMDEDVGSGAREEAGGVYRVQLKRENK
uniref:late embryogenesis abundant protein ECP63 n=1 Tax=Erigeron canadensis TaxID=72917 RepID=UPI001CB918E9|nr:late embryogenesis abundant protein ECP63 [Erigeron canadensis]